MKNRPRRILRHQHDKLSDYYVDNYHHTTIHRFFVLQIRSGIEDTRGSIIKNDDNDGTDITLNNNDLQNERRSQHQPAPHHQLHLLDRHVASSPSPLSVAAVCQDGIAFISLHHDVDGILSTQTTSILDCNKIGRLMQQPDDNDFAGDAAATTSIASTTLINTNKNNNNNTNNKENISEGSKPRYEIFVDLPLSFRGPLRIETIYENNSNQHSTQHSQSTSKSLSSIRLSPPPMSLLTAGWRADSITLHNCQYWERINGTGGTSVFFTHSFIEYHCLYYYHINNLVTGSADEYIHD